MDSILGDYFGFVTALVDALKAEHPTIDGAYGFPAACPLIVTRRILNNNLINNRCTPNDTHVFSRSPSSAPYFPAKK